MKLEYELKKDDYVAFNMHVAKHSRTVRRSLVGQR